MGRSDHHIRLRANHGEQLGGLFDGFAEMNAGDVIGQNHLLGIVSRQPDDGNPVSTALKYPVGLKHPLATPVDIGREHRKSNPGALFG